MSPWTTRLAIVFFSVGIPLQTPLAESTSAQIKQDNRLYSVGLGTTRLIDRGNAQGVSLSVSNDNAYPLLVHSQVMSEDRSAPAPFVVTPPLFRLDGHQQSRIRAVRTGGSIAPDRESLNWLCTTGIPPQEEDAWANESTVRPDTALLKLQIKMTRCIKLFTRPAGVKGDPETAAATLIWSRQREKLTVSNPSPFFLTLKSLRVGNHKLEPGEKGMVPPFETLSFPLPADVSGTVRWTVITDLGGDSRMFEAALR